MAATGEFTADWSGANQNPYVDANFNVLNEDAQILNGGLRDSASGGGPTKVVYNGQINRANVIVSRVEFQEGGILWSDPRGPALNDPTTGVGYWLRVNGNECIIRKQASIADEGDNLGTKATGLVIAAGDIFELSIDPNGLITAKQGTTTLTSVSDIDHLATVSPAAQVQWGSINATSLSSFGADGVTSADLSLTDVNGNNEISSNAAIVISCTMGETVTGATLDGVALTILSQGYSSVTCEAVDLHTTTSPPDAVVSLVITDGVTSPAQDVTWRSAAGLTSIVATSITTSPPGLLATTTQTAVVGDIYEGPTTAADGQSALTYVSDGPHRNLDPAAPNATVTEGWFYDVSASSWEIITETTNRADGALAPSWKAVPTPPACVVGLAYSYVMTGILDGDRPMTLTLETGELPAGLSINSTNESIEGTPTAAGEFINLTIGAANAV